MTEIDDLFRQYSTLRDLDPGALRRALDDRLLFDRLVAEGGRGLTAVEQARTAEIGERIHAAAQARFGRKRARSSWLATERGWRSYAPDQLHSLTTATASVAVLAIDVLANVLSGSASAAVVALRSGSLSVDRVDPESGARESCDDCARRLVSPPTLAQGTDGARFTCGAEFEFFDEPHLAAGFDSGACIVELTNPARVGGPSFRTRLSAQGTIVRAQFDAPAPFDTEELPGGRIRTLRFALIPPGPIARAVLSM